MGEIHWVNICQSVVTLVPEGSLLADSSYIKSPEMQKDTIQVALIPHPLGMLELCKYLQPIIALLN